MALWNIVSGLFVRLVVSCCRCDSICIIIKAKASYACLNYISIWLTRICVGGTTLMMSILGVVEQGLRILMVLGRKCRIRLINVRIWFAEVII